ncbi:uncharacterized protein DUF4269 [Bradyrhizobium sp. R2.2-H]|nr:uncharacterized protein DUF4269 [Bradyrhizobium sp. Y-H1]TCU77772.1 uncharacterized protein DUF4269 [Bradyrhizobium sp. R2.2-H]
MPRSIPNYEAAIDSSGLLEELREFDPRVVGTLPLDLSTPTSDVDVVCHVTDTAAFAEIVWRRYSLCEGFALYQWRSSLRPVVARFNWGGWPFELFGDPRPVDQQEGWLHFEIERRLLALDDGRLRKAVADHRARGMKTEPAFAVVLGIAGDPYAGLLALARESDAHLRARLERL